MARWLVGMAVYLEMGPWGENRAQLADGEGRASSLLLGWGEFFCWRLPNGPLEWPMVHSEDESVFQASGRETFANPQASAERCWTQPFLRAPVHFLSTRGWQVSKCIIRFCFWESQVIIHQLCNALGFVMTFSYMYSMLWLFSPPSPFSLSVPLLFQYFRKRNLDSTYERKCVAFVFLSLVYFIEGNGGVMGSMCCEKGGGQFGGRKGSGKMWRGKGRAVGEE